MLCLSHRHRPLRCGDIHRCVHTMGRTNPGLEIRSGAVESISFSAGGPVHRSERSSAGRPRQEGDRSIPPEPPRKAPSSPRLALSRAAHGCSQGRDASSVWGRLDPPVVSSGPQCAAAH